MPQYNSWNVKVEKTAELHLFIDGKHSTEFLSSNITDQKQRNILPLSGKITSLLPDSEKEGWIQVDLGDKSLKLRIARFESTSLFEKKIKDVEALLKFWKECGEFLSPSKLPCDLHSRHSSILIFENSMESSESLNISENVDIIQSSDLFSSDGKVPTSSIKSNTDCEDGEDDDGKTDTVCKDDHKSTNVPGSEDDKLITSIPESDTDDVDNEEVITRCSLLQSISEKKVVYRMLNIFDLKGPPPRYQVREIDHDFVDRLSEVMLEKCSISVDNAPTICGLIDIDKADFKEENLSKYKIYIIDGNHSVKAQRAAYKRTKNPVFKYRCVNIYCGLTEEEALFPWRFQK